MDLDATTDTIDFHRKNPDVSLEQHINNKRVQIGFEVKDKFKIYLDLRFWILFREIELGRDKNAELNAELIQLLNLIKSLVDKGIAVCPISETIFIEMMKQSDGRTRLATAKLMDLLSLGLTFIVNSERARIELCHILSLLGGVKNLIPLDQLIWTKPFFIFNTMRPPLTSIEWLDNPIKQKSQFDDNWITTFTEMISDFDFEKWKQPNWQSTANRANSGIKEYSDEIRSFNQAYDFEIFSGLSPYSEEILKILGEIRNSRGLAELEGSGENLSDKKRFSRFSKSLRTLHIGACMHAALRWDKKRQFTGNDLPDFSHAEAALGYCDLFLTEKPLKAFLSQNHLRSKIDSPCNVESSAAGGIKVLNIIER